MSAEIKNRWEQPELRQVSYWLLGGFIWRVLLAAGLPPGFDEAYYYLYTRHLDWSYFDHPLLVAVTTGLGPWLLGDVSGFSIRLGSVLLYTGTLGLLYLTGRQLFSVRAGMLTVAIASLIPIFQVGFGVLTLPDSPLMFFWTATLYVASCEFFPQTNQADQRHPDYQPTPRLALLGLCVGLACLGKYHGLALGFGLVGFCLTQSQYRRALISPWALASVGLFLLAISPILLWNAQYDWVSLRFQSGRAVPDRGYSVLDLLVTVLVGTAYLFPSLGFPLWWVSGRSLQQFLPGSHSLKLSGFTAGKLRAPVALLLWLSLPLMLVFTLMGGYRPILPTWAMPGFWTATLLLGNWAASLKPVPLTRWLMGTGLVIASVMLVALSHVMLGTLQKPSQFAIFGGLVPATEDASVQLIDIQQLRQGFAKTPAVAAALDQTDFLFTNDIYLAGQVGMAIAPLSSKPLTCLDADLRGFAFWSTSESWVGQDGLLVTTPTRVDQDLAQFGGYFANLEPAGRLDLQRGGIKVSTLLIYRGQRLLRPYPRPYGRTT